MMTHRVRHASEEKFGESAVSASADHQQVGLHLPCGRASALQPEGRRPLASRIRPSRRQAARSSARGRRTAPVGLRPGRQSRWTRSAVPERSGSAASTPVRRRRAHRAGGHSPRTSRPPRRNRPNRPHPPRSWSSPSCPTSLVSGGADDRRAIAAPERETWRMARGGPKVPIFLSHPATNDEWRPMGVGTSDPGREPRGRRR